MHGTRRCKRSPEILSVFEGSLPTTYRIGPERDSQAGYGIWAFVAGLLKGGKENKGQRLAHLRDRAEIFPSDPAQSAVE